MVGYFNLPLLEQTHALAETWIATWQPYDPSALGWYILGQLAFDREDPKEALWLSLKPIVFSSQSPTDYLDHCYALAIIAATSIGDTQAAQRLLAEMRERQLTWPKTPTLQPYRAYFDDGID